MRADGSFDGLVFAQLVSGGVVVLVVVAAVRVVDSGGAVVSVGPIPAPTCLHPRATEAKAQMTKKAVTSVDRFIEPPNPKHQNPLDARFSM
jgi:hypothetical protein